LKIVTALHAVTERDTLKMQVAMFTEQQPKSLENKLSWV